MTVAPSAPANPEVLESFYPTPDRLEVLIQEGIEKEPEFAEKVESLFDGQVEKWDRESIATLLRSDVNQLAMTDLILARSDAIRMEHPDFDYQNVEALQEQLRLVGDTLKSMDRWEAAMTDGGVAVAPAMGEVAAENVEKATEKKGLLRRALSAVGHFYKKHPIVASLLTVGAVLAVVAGGVAGGAYLSGNWAELMSRVAGAARRTGSSVGFAAEVTEPVTEVLPGAGAEGLGGLETVVSP